MASQRKNNKQLVTVARALKVLRYDGTVRCERLDPITGELVPLSDAAVARALRIYNMHPSQLLRRAPTREMQSLHPNHVWQIDASLCVLYYLSNGQAVGNGLQVLDADKFYKNKPEALKRVESERVWRYVVTDHYSGSVFAHYVLGAESAVNMADAFIAAICPREVDGQRDPFCGVPQMIYMDRGAANISGAARNLFKRLRVRQEAHMPGAPWATGQVEKGQDIVERDYESSLRFQPVYSLDELNSGAYMWSRHFNASEVHSRHGKTRTDVWMTIQPEQLRVPPSAELCRTLMTHEPESRVVTQTQTVEFKGREYDVSAIEGRPVLVGEKLLMALNPYAADTAWVVDVADDGSEAMHPVPAVARNEAGFRADATVFGQGWHSRPQTALQLNQKEIERHTYDADSNEQAAQAKKRRELPFGGRIDPLRQAREARLPTPIGKRGTELVPTVQLPAIDTTPRLLPIFAAAQQLAALGVAMGAERFALLGQWYPDGQVPDDQIEALRQRLTVRAGLRVVGSDAAHD